MLKFVADHNFDNAILKGLKRKLPELDIIRVQDIGHAESDDPVILDWAAHEGRVLLTHDMATMTFFAYERVRKGQAMPGVFEVPDQLPIGDAISDLLLLAQGSLDAEWEGQIIYLPLR